MCLAIVGIVKSILIASFATRREPAQSQRLSVGNIEMVLDSVTDPPAVIAPVEALKPKIEIVLA